MRRLLAFTLVELLVVITAIVLLLALLMPALNQAVYQAELASCGANQHGVAAGASVYAISFRRQWPQTGASWGLDSSRDCWAGGTAPVKTQDRIAVFPSTDLSPSSC